MTKKQKDVSCLILAGGESKRFGEDKALFDFDGFKFIERALNVALDVSNDVVISVREESKIKQYRTLTADITEKRYKKDRKGKPPNIKLVSDDCRCGLRGPLKGIFSSVKDLSGSFVLIMECDAPFFNTEAAILLIDKIKTEPVRGVAPLWPNSVVEPLLSCYAIKDITRILTMLNDYSLALKDDFLFNDTVNILRLLPSVYYYSVIDIVKQGVKLKPDIFININSKKDLKSITRGKKILPAYIAPLMQGNAKSVRIKRVNRFFNIIKPDNKPYGNMAMALYYWWVYTLTGNLIYLKKSINLFEKDSAVYLKNGLNFMGDKLIKILPRPIII